MVSYRDFTVHLRANGCSLIRQGANHEIWGNGTHQSSVPRHRQIVKITCWAICKQLAIPKFPPR